MALPVTIPNTFANATSSIPLSQLDANFSTLANAVNGINSGSETLANLKASNVTITGGVISNVTLDNVTVDVETLSNVTINGGNVTVTNMTATTGNVNTINVTTINARDGTASMSLANSTGILSLSNVLVTTAGTSAAPAIVPTGDLNTGIFFPAADTIAFAEGGAEAMRINSSGNVGIGTSSPAYKLDVATGAIQVKTGASITSTIYDWLIGYSGDEGYGVKISTIQGSSSTRHGMAFYTSFAALPAERMRITDDGNVGIGTTSPSYKLTVTSSSTDANNVLTGSGIVVGSTIGLRERGNSNGISGTTYASQIYQGASGGGHLEIYNVSSTYGLVFGTNTTERARIDSSGNVGIGTTSPSSFTAENDSKLTVGTGSGNGGITIYTGNTSQGGIFFADGTTGAETYSGILRYNHASNAMLFYTNGLNERMRIDSSGNVGIGTTSPSYRLTVSSAQSTAANNTATGSAVAVNNLYVRLRGLSNGISGNPYTTQLFTDTSADNFEIYNAAANYALVFGTNSTERARITSGGYFKASDNGTYVGSTGAYHEFYQSANDTALVVRAVNASYNTIALQVNIDRNTSNNSFSAIRYYNQGAAQVRFIVADSGAIATAGSISLGTDTAATSGIGVQFPATQSASSDANTLDDYEEGTFTPTVTANSGTITTVTSKSGKYTKIGNTVCVSISFTITDNGTGAGYLIAGNLPFTVSSANAAAGINWFAGKALTCLVSSTSIASYTYDGVYPGANNGTYYFTAVYQV